MAKIVNCCMCGQPCEESSHGLGIVGLLFGFPMHWGSFCGDECKRKWNGGGHVWFGKKWRQQVVAVIIIAVILYIVVKFM